MFRIQSVGVFLRETVRDFKKGRRPKHMQSREKQLKQDMNLLKDPGGLQPFPVDNSDRRPANSTLGRGLFILLGSNQGYGSLMVFTSLKVFHIWARSMLSGGPRRPCSRPLCWADGAKSTQWEKLSSIYPLAGVWRFSQWCCVIVKMPPFLTNCNFQLHFIFLLVGLNFQD